MGGIGTSATIIEGRRWDISLVDSCGKVHIVKAYGVPDILQENWSFPSIMNLAVRFPHIPKDVFLAQGSRPLDILIGTDALKLIPKCIYGLDCKACNRGLCCYKSKFGLGWVPVGKCGRKSSSQISCPSTFSICVQKVVPQTSESFCFGEALGNDPVPTCYSLCIVAAISVLLIRHQVVPRKKGTTVILKITVSLRHRLA